MSDDEFAKIDPEDDKRRAQAGDPVVDPYDDTDDGKKPEDEDEDEENEFGDDATIL